MRKLVILGLLFLVVFSQSVFGENITFEASLERTTVSPGNPLYLYLKISGTQNVKAPQVSPIDGLQIKYIGPSTQISVVNTKMSQSITHTYLIFPKKNGQYKIGPFFIDYKGQSYRAEAVTLNVGGVATRSGSSGNSAPVRSGIPSSISSIANQTNNTSTGFYDDDRIFLTIETDRKEVYVNESLMLTIKLYVDNTNLRDIEFPSYEHEGFSTDQFGEPERRKEATRGTTYDVLIFKQELFAVKEGEYVLGPARLGCKMLVKKERARKSSLFGRSIFDDDFFSSGLFGYQEFPIDLESNEIPIKVRPFPLSERPENFKGAVGNFNLDVAVNPKKVKVGDPVSLRIAISGNGNLDTVTAPSLTDTENIKVYEPQSSKKGNQKIYEQILIPKSDEVKEIPEVSFSFFNPKIGRYVTLTRGPFPVEVTKKPESESVIKIFTPSGTENTFYPQEEVGQDIVYIKETAGTLSSRNSFLYKNHIFWILQIVLFVLFLVFNVVYSQKQRMRTDKTYARFQKAPKAARKSLRKAETFLSKNNVDQFYDIIFRTLQDYLSNRLDLPKGNVTVNMINDKLDPEKYDQNIIEWIHEVFTSCEMARYASITPGIEEPGAILEKVKNIIDYMERVKF